MVPAPERGRSCQIVTTPEAPNALVSAIIPTWNTREMTVECVRSLLHHTSVALEIVVIDNGSSDGTADAIAEEFPGVRLIRNEANRGGNGATNQGLAASTGDFILLMNSDTYVTDDVIGRAVRRLQDSQREDVIGGELRYPDGRLQYRAFRRMSIRRSVLDRFWLYRLLPRSSRANVMLGHHFDGTREVEVDWLAGPFVLMRREVYETVGGIEPRWELYGGDDSEWGPRMRKAGFRLVYAPDLGTMWHYGSATASQLWDDTALLSRNHRIGIQVYKHLHGPLRGAIYQLVELVGVTFRWLVHGAAATVLRSAYHRDQAERHKNLARAYLASDDRA